MMRGEKRLAERAGGAIMNRSAATGGCPEAGSSQVPEREGKTLNKMEAAARMISAWHTFKKNHPKFGPFMKAVENAGVTEGTVMEMTFRTPDGQNYTTNVKVQESDLPLFEILGEVLS